MGVHISFNRTCDRCGKPFDMQRITYEGGLPKLEPKPLVLIDGGVEIFSFDDLCVSCESVVGKLIKRLKLDDEELKTDEGAKAKTDELTEPNVKKEEPAAPRAGDEKDHPF